MQAEAQALRVRQRIDQAVDQIRLCARYLAVFSPHRIDAVVRVPQHGRDFVGEQAGCVHYAAGIHRLHRCVASGPGGISGANPYLNGILLRFEPHDSGMGEDIGALLGGHARVGLDQLFARDDPGRGHLECRAPFDVWFARADSGAVHDPQAFQSVREAALDKVGEFGFFFRGRCDHQLSCSPVRDVVRGAELVGQPVAGQTMPRLERPRRVVQPGVNHAAVARARDHAELRHLIEQKDVVPPLRNGARDRAAHHSAADDHNVGAVHRR